MNTVDCTITERYKSLAKTTERFTFDFGYDTKVELYENDKRINYVETEF